ncbi:MAG: polyphosphate polymerase domain-containing protein [Gammaproteobacteria bacterium]|nr:polyphosphate polymerase domain-containing protein [Gammaproteobacteria bacterium]
MQSLIDLPLADDVDSVLSTFSSHGLSDLNNASLMNRVDSKFLVNRDQLPLILQHCRDQYSVLEIEQRQRFKYQSCYYDTGDLTFFYQHHQGKLNRIKLRHRSYVDTGTSFVELKFKNNKGRTIKTRVAAGDNPIVALERAQPFLIDQGVSNLDDLKAVQTGQYSRISLANETLGERLTIDSDLSFFNLTNWQSKTLSNVVILELKQHRHNRRSPLYQLMRTMAVRPQSFSKYCIGMALTRDPSLRVNRFKKNLLNLNKIEQQRVSL